jgi:Xaa-Pro aminopeptidase
MSSSIPILDTVPVPQPQMPRRADIELKQVKIAKLLADTGCESILLLERVNVRWMTSGACERGIYHAEECPAVFANPHQRWIICSNVDTQRLFDEELDGMGFQVKEWPGTVTREHFLAELCHGRKMAADQPFRDFHHVGTFLAQERRRLGRYEQKQLSEIGRLTAQALEAAARNIQPGDREDEIAGHLAHRLLKRGVEPVTLAVAGDDRGRLYRRPGYTATPVRDRCLLQATACRNGMFATASRTVAFGTLSDETRTEFETAARLMAMWQATIRAGDRPHAVYDIAKAALKDTPFEHEYRLQPPGWWTGRSPSEGLFTPSSAERVAEGNALVWQARIGGTAVCETLQVQENGIFPIAPVEDWPFRRYVIQGNRYDIPDLLIREPS